MQALQELSDNFSNTSVERCSQQGQGIASVRLEQPTAEAPSAAFACHESQPQRRAQQLSSAGLGCTIQDDIPSTELSVSLTELLGTKAKSISAAAASNSLWQRTTSDSSRMLIRRSVGGAALSPDDPCARQAEPTKIHSQQQRQWYLFRRAAWAEARRQLQAQRKDSLCSSEAGLADAGGVGAVQRLVAAWWHEYKNEMMSERDEVYVHAENEAVDCSQKQSHIAVAGAAAKGTVLTQISRRRNSNTDPGSSSQGRRLGDTGKAGTSISKNSGMRSTKHPDQAEQFARTARYVWNRFGARAWESQLTNDEARALYRAWA